LNLVVAIPAAGLVYIADWHDITQSIRAEGENILVYFAASPDGEPLSFGYRRFSYGLVLLLALILAVPDVEMRMRLKILLIGLSVIYALQVIRLAAMVLNHYSQHVGYQGEPIYPFLYRKVLHYFNKMMLRLEGHLIPVAIWAGLYLYYKWYPRYITRKRKERGGRLSAV
jgi:hypothetical protein